MYKRVCIFAHYDKDNIVDPYVYYYLEELKKVIQKIIFVTVSDILKNDLDNLEKLDIVVIKRENIGYDFYSYKVGLERINLKSYDELLLCNDSTFGPIYPIVSLFDSMQNQKCDFWGITSSLLISNHLQSYFLVFKKDILQSTVFNDFWSNLCILEDKDEIIKQYEVGLSTILYSKGYTGDSFIKYNIKKVGIIKNLYKNLYKKPYKIYKFIIYPKLYVKTIMDKRSNASIDFWDELLVKLKIPFIKKSLITDKSMKKSNIIKLKNIFEDTVIETKYPFYLITNYYDRHLQ